MNWRCITLVAVIASLPWRARADEPLALSTALDLAVSHSKEAQLARLKVEESDWASTAARRQRYPHITAYGLGGYYFRPIDLKVKEGSLTTTLDTVGIDLGLGSLSSLTGPFPATDLTLVHGSHTQLVGGISILQPLTQQWRIGSGVTVADAARTAGQREAAFTLARIRFAVERLFAGLLVEQSRQSAAIARLAYEERRLRDAENAVEVDEALDEAALGLRAATLEARTNLTRSRQQSARLALQLADLIGQPGTESFSLVPDLPVRAEHPLAYWVEKAAQNPERQIAAATAEQARAAVRAARQTHIPDLSAFASGFAQDGLPLAPETGGMVGLTLNWDVFDFGRRDAEISRTRIRQRSAELDRDRREEKAARDIRVAYQDFTYARELIALADQAVAYRRRAAELAAQATAHDLALESKALGAIADLRKAEAELRAAHIQQHLALLELYFLAGAL